MPTLLTTLLITAIAFIGAVISYKFISGKTFEEATYLCRDTVLKICKSAFKDLLTTPAEIKTYPIYIGYIDNCLYLDRVEHYFKDLRVFYKIVNFDVTFSLNSNINVYRFNCIGLKQDVEEKELITILQKLSVLALKKHIQDNMDSSFISVTTLQDLVAVELNAKDMLSIYFARTDQGLANIKQIQQRVRNSYLNNQKDAEDLFLIEDWEEDFWN